MSRYTGPSCKLCRREGCKLFLKGDRCLGSKCAMERRPTVPGPHTQSRRAPKEYGLQLREKQKARRFYGVQEKQFRKYYVRADKQEGIAGENLLSILERRFDNAVYRMGIASSRKEARQLISHGHFKINGRKSDVPSIILNVGDVIEICENSKKSAKIKALIEDMATIVPPQWLEVDKDAVKAKMIAIPKREDVDFPFEEQRIIELYSK